MGTTPLPHRLDGVRHAWTDDGRRLPVLDVTQPAFALETDPEKLEESAQAVVEEAHILLGVVRGRGSAGPRVRNPRPASGIRSYRAKLGAEGLGWVRWLRWLRTPQSFLLVHALQLRAHALIRLLAAGMVPAMARRPAAPLHLVNIGGGAAADSLNALILLARDRPFLVEGRTTRIHVLDLDAAGPHFGARALEALRAPGAPLHRVDATLEHVPYDWNRPAALAEHLARWREDDAVMAGSSEGALLEYGTDEAVLGNLQALRAGVPPGFVLACSAWRDDELALTARSFRGRDQPLRPHSRESLRALADRIEWNVQWSQEGNLLHHVLLLRPR